MGKKKRSTRQSTDSHGKTNGDANSLGQDNTKNGGNGDNLRWIFTTLTLTTILPGIVVAAAWAVGQSEALRSISEGGSRPHFLVRLVLSIFLDATLGHAFYVLLLPPARSLGRLLPGAVVPKDPVACERQEAEQDDPSLTWPSPTAISRLPPDWVVVAASAASKSVREKQQQPLFLNHVRGSTRLRHATQRLSSALGTLTMVTIMSRWVDRIPMSDIGLDPFPTDAVWGLFVGSSVVFFLLAAEVGLGWLRVVGLFEVVAPGESLPLNLLWDVIFHAAVSVNEEVSMRGWILVHAARYVHAAWGASTTVAMATSVSLQATMFALLHAGSPGATRVGLTNLVVGGASAALNVFVSGGLSFGIGWHFGWNIFMGHLLGMSTSGIPMSAKIVSVVPHPGRSHLHGGRFGPEQSPLAPAAYLLGCAALVYLYGAEGITLWRERLVVTEV